jgi:hypothetical protein
MHTLVWVLALLGAIFGGIELILGVRAAESAPQQAVVAAVAIGCGVLPYVFARACDELANYNRPPRPRVGEFATPVKRANEPRP